MVSQAIMDRDKLLRLQRREDELLEKAQARHKKRTAEISVALSLMDDKETADAINSVLAMLMDGEERVADVRPSVEQLFTEGAERAIAAASANSKGKRSRRGRHYHRILGVLPAIEGDVITQPIVRAKLVDHYPEYGASVQVPTISSTLRQLREDGILELVNEGAGGRPHEYRRVA